MVYVAGKNFSRRVGYSSKISVTSLVLKDENYLISGGFTDGLIKVWDLRRTYMATAARQPAPVYCLPVGATVTSLVLQSGGSKLYASCKNNAIYCFDAINFNEKPGN
ncbi:hypothetical protein B566_EDAN009033 [Ephemera danica]|nr:hypothetical protein B566_EDAN009033 [Ephemera danica]